MKTFNCHAVTIDLKNITKIWENEDILQDYKDMLRDDYCKKYYIKTVQRAPDGKYIHTYIYIQICTETLLNSTRNCIIWHRRRALLLLLRRSATHPITALLREHSSTTKRRAVFNASQKTTSGLSLNQLQEKATNLQEDIQTPHTKIEVIKICIHTWHRKDVPLYMDCRRPTTTAKKYSARLTQRQPERFSKRERWEWKMHYGKL